MNDDSMDNNITTNKTWIESQKSRYDINKLIQYDNHLFYEDDNTLFSLISFNFEPSDLLMQFIEKKLYEYDSVSFKYLDVDEDAYKNLNMRFSNDKFLFCVQDMWSAPAMKINLDYSLDKYVKNCDQNIRRNYMRAMNNKENSSFKAVVANEDNILKCWNDVLYIDFNSWKHDEYSDMKSLNREDLQYIFMLLNNNDLCSLYILYEHNEPMAYSLMIRNGIGLKWYAVKWGSSKKGRDNYSGVICLFQHLDYLIEKQRNENVSDFIDIDFWGRHQRVYDALANYHIKRAHLAIRRNKNETV